MRVKSLLASIMSVGFLSIANASIDTRYQYGAVDLGESVVLPITNAAITLNPEIDAVNPRDPRIKTVIDYVKMNGKGVSIVFFNPENLRYVKKLNEMFNLNGVYATQPQLSNNKNMMYFNQVRIYVIENHNLKIESSELSRPSPILIKAAPVEDSDDE